MEMSVLSQHDRRNPAGNDATSSRQDDLRVPYDSPCLVQQDSQDPTGVLTTFPMEDLRKIIRRRCFTTDQPVVVANYCPPIVSNLESSAPRLRFDGNPLNGNSSTAISYGPPFQFPTCSPEEVSPSLPSADPVPRKDCFLIAGAKGVVCIYDVGKAQGSAELLVYDWSTDGFNVLPPSNIHPIKLMQVRADDNGDYKVLVCGRATMNNTEDPSLINCTMVYSSTTCAWEPCKGNSPSFCGMEYQNGAYYKDSDRELLVCFAAADEEGSRGVVVYDFKKKQWQDFTKHRVGAVTGSSKSSNIIPRLITAHLIGCGGSIFLLREQGISGSDKQFFVHKLNPDTLEEKELVRDVRPYKGVGGPGSRGLGAYPKFDCILGSATLIECAGSVFVISEQEISDERFICIHHLDGDSWKEIKRLKRTRYRGPPWEIDEIDAYIKRLEQALEISKTTPPWKFIADGLKSEGYNRLEKPCEDLLGTLRRERRDIQNFIQNNPTIEVWNMTKEERSRHKLPRRFTESWYYKLEELIPVKKGSGQKRSQIVNAVRDQDNDSLVTLASSLATSAALPASLVQTPLVLGVKDSIDVEQVEVDRSPCMAAITSEVVKLRDVDGRREWTNAEILESKKIDLENKKVDLKMKEIDLENKKLDIQVKLQLEKNKAPEDCEEPPTKKPRKRVCRK
ncbi:hypothetical protein M758_1G062000 [Ceratodon purpureus]|nr:hypothetical protein M758_1G062000 [Ceratodon purpureus]